MLRSAYVLAGLLCNFIDCEKNEIFWLGYVVAERQTVARKIHKKIQFQFFWLYLRETTNWWRIPKVSDTTKNEIAKVDAAGAAVDVAKKLVKWDF